MGLGVSLPMLYLGSEMSIGMGLKNAIIAFIVSTAILTVLCLVTTLIGTRTRLSTYMILRFPFGKQGAKLINFLVGVSLLGWFAVALELLSDAINTTLSVLLEIDISLSIIIIIGSIFITTTTIFGIRTLEKLANIAVPILLLFLIYVVYKAIGDGQASIQTTTAIPSLSLFQGISALVGSSVLVPVLMADFSRYISNDRQSLLSILGITIGTPVVWIIAAILADKTGEADIILIMNSYKLVLPAFVLIFVSTWVTNATNLYSVSLTLSTITETWSYTRLTILSGVLGTALALTGFSEYFIDFLNMLAIFSPAIASIYILDFFLVKKQDYDLSKIEEWGVRALVSWTIGSGFACLTYYEILSFTGAYFVDAFLIGGFVYWISNRLR